MSLSQALNQFAQNLGRYPKEAAMNDNSVWPVVTAVMVVLAVAVCLAMAGDIRFAVIGVL